MKFQSPKFSPAIATKPLGLAGFSLPELMVAMTVLVLLIALVIEMMNSATAVITGSGAHQDADSQARMVFDRLANDFASMPKRSDLDLLFSKRDGGSDGANDQLYFYSSVSGYFDSSSNTSWQSPVSLVAYRVNQAFTLERMAKGMLWTASGTSCGVVFLTCSGSSTSFAPDPRSTLEGDTLLRNVFDGTDADYAPFSQGVYRLEFCYYLKDGTYSNKPVMASAGFVSNLTADAAPTKGADRGLGYSAGSRWYDTAAKRAYICQSADAKAAVWTPLGLEDVASVVVAVAVLDDITRKRVSDLTQAVKALPDPADSDLAASSPQLMASLWQSIVNQPGFAEKCGMPKTAAARVRIYQRYFSVSTP